MLNLQYSVSCKIICTILYSWAVKARGGLQSWCLSTDNEVQRIYISYRRDSTGHHHLTKMWLTQPLPCSVCYTPTTWPSDRVGGERLGESQIFVRRWLVLSLLSLIYILWWGHMYFKGSKFTKSPPPFNLIRVPVVNWLPTVWNYFFISQISQKKFKKTFHSQ